MTAAVTALFVAVLIAELVSALSVAHAKRTLS